MNRVLPACPRPSVRESLSSWVERAGLFYGCEYEHWLGPVMAATEYSPGRPDLDVDASRLIRRQFHQWTGIAMRHLPLADPVAESDRLPVRARITHCPACWDDDVAQGGQPYIRDFWGRWCTIHCARHDRFLSTRTTDLAQFHNLLQWMPNWQSERRWLASFDMPREMGQLGEVQRYSTGNSQLWTPSQ